MVSPLPASLLALAPTSLPNRRQTRYAGDNQCVQLDGLAEHDQAQLRALYRRLSELLFALSDPASDDAGKWQAVARWAEQYPLDTFVGEIHELGIASHAEGADNENLAKALHDIRGGALSALLGRLELLGRRPHNSGELNTLFVLTRDHLKIMRSALVGLDEPRRQADREPKAHAMQLMVAKWHEAVVGPKLEGRSIRLFMDCRYEGALTECCLESAADRIFYNLANNAVRHAATDRLDMAVFPVPDAAGSILRFVLSNEVNDKDAAYLRSVTAGSQAHGSDKDRETPLLPLFTPRVSTTGSGFGLTVVADFVAGAFGLRDRVQALRERYVGAILEGNTFRIWFHWPAGNPALPPKTDDYHNPAQSLSEP